MDRDDEVDVVSGGLDVTIWRIQSFVFVPPFLVEFFGGLDGINTNRIHAGGRVFLDFARNLNAGRPVLVKDWERGAQEKVRLACFVFGNLQVKILNYRRVWNIKSLAAIFGLK